MNSLGEYAGNLVSHIIRPAFDTWVFWPRQDLVSMLRHAYLVTSSTLSEMLNFVDSSSFKLQAFLIKHIFQPRRCPWCNGYRRRKWTRRHEFKSWTRLIAFHIALIPLGKVWIQLSSFQLWVNSRTARWDNLSRRRKILNSNLLNFT